MLFCGFKIKAETLAKIKRKANLEDTGISQVIRTSLEREFDCLEFKENTQEKW